MELIIDKNTKLNRIKNKEDYTSLVIKTKVNPKKLKDFINIKSLTIDYVDKYGGNYNEEHLNELCFIKNIEKLIFKQIKVFGKTRTYDKIDYKFYIPNLKSIEFPACITDFNKYYLENAMNIEEIIFNTGMSKDIYFYGFIYLYLDNLKRIIIKYCEKEYIIEPDYKIEDLNMFEFIFDKIRLGYDSNVCKTEIDIYIDNDIIKKSTLYSIDRFDSEIIIPDYITGITGYGEGTRKISFNLKLLEFIDGYTEIIENNYVNKLECIELRNNNDMMLNPSIIINVKDYGELNKVYFNDNLLYLEYKDKTITVNSKGIINKVLKNTLIIDKEEHEKKGLKEYTLEELEEYVSYLKLLKLSSDEEYKNAMEIVEDRVIKKLKL